MAARKPNIDRIAREGFCGQVLTVPPGYPPGSDVACMSLFGYDPAECYTGRAPIEAYGMGITMGHRCGLPLQPRLPGRQAPEGAYGRLLRRPHHHRGGKNPGRRLCRGRRERGIPVLPGRKLSPHHDLERRRLEMATTPPHDILDKEVIDHMPKGMAQEHHQAHERLADIPERASGQQGADKTGGSCRQTASGSGVRERSLTFPPSMRNMGSRARWLRRWTW